MTVGGVKPDVQVSGGAAAFLRRLLWLIDVGRGLSGFHVAFAAVCTSVVVAAVTVHFE